MPRFQFGLIWIADIRSYLLLFTFYFLLFEPGAKMTVGFDLDCIWYLNLMPRFQLGLILLFTAVFTGEVPLSLVSMNSFDLIDRGSISLTVENYYETHMLPHIVGCDERPAVFTNLRNLRSQCFSSISLFVLATLN